MTTLIRPFGGLTKTSERVIAWSIRNTGSLRGQLRSGHYRSPGSSTLPRRYWYLGCNFAKAPESCPMLNIGETTTSSNMQDVLPLFQLWRVSCLGVSNASKRPSEGEGLFATDFSNVFTGFNKWSYNKSGIWGFDTDKAIISFKTAAALIASLELMNQNRNLCQHPTRKDYSFKKPSRIDVCPKCLRLLEKWRLILTKN